MLKREQFLCIELSTKESGMKYVMYAGSVLMKQNVLEHPPVTYSDGPSPLLMVAEDPVPYGK